MDTSSASRVGLCDHFSSSRPSSIECGPDAPALCEDRAVDTFDTNPLPRWDITNRNNSTYEILDGGLRLIPGANTGWDRQRENGIFWSQRVDGDFRVRVSVVIADSEGRFPTGAFNTAGLLAQGPRSDGGPNWVALDFGSQDALSADGGFETGGFWRNTVGGSTTNWVTAVNGRTYTDMVLCRQGNDFTGCFTLDGAWLCAGQTFTRNDFEGLALDVGVTASANGPTASIQPEFRYVSFETPSTPCEEAQSVCVQ